MGKKFVRLRSRRILPAEPKNYRNLANIEDKLFKIIATDVINNVYVSLTNVDGAIISQPYEAKISPLRYGSPVDLTYALLQDVDAVTVNIIYGNGSTRV